MLAETETHQGAPGRAGASQPEIRPYRPTDHRACRALWAQMVEDRRERYGDPALGGTDPGAGFEEYLTRLDLTGMWLAERAGASGTAASGTAASGTAASAGAVVGLAGLVIEGRAGRVDPLIVAAGHRDGGVGRALLDAVVAAARKRSLASLTVSPAARDVESIRWYHSAGFTDLAAVTLTMAVAGRGGQPRDSVDLHGRRFTY